MIDESESSSDRFARLTRATADLKPSPDFGARVMVFVSRMPQRDVSSWIARLGPISIPTFTIIAAILTFWAVDTDSDYQDTMMVVSYDLEQEWE